MTPIDEYAWRSGLHGRINSMGIIEAMADTVIVHGVPQHVRSDSRPEITAKIVCNWFADVSAKTLDIEPGSLWKNGCCESFNGKLRGELLNGEIFYSLKEASGVTARWRKHYNTVRPHSSLGKRPPAPQTSNSFATPLDQGAPIQ